MSEHEVAAVEARLEIPRLVASGCDGVSAQAFEFPEDTSPPKNGPITTMLSS